MDTKAVKRIASKEVKSHEKRMHKMAKGGVAKMHKGGKTNEDMLSMGRGMAKVNDQKTGLKG
jgi:hypothetical protein